MNVALFPSAFHPSLGGVEELTHKLAVTLQQLGHQVIVISNRWPRDLPEHEDYRGVTHYRLPMRFPGGGFKSHLTYHLTNRSIRSKLAAILERHQIDVLHVQCVSTQAHYAVAMKQSLGFPLVVTLQGELTMDATQLYQRRERARRLMRVTLNAADTVTACSRQTLDEAEEFLGHPWQVPASVVYNGVAVEELATATAYKHHRPFIFAIGRHVPQKGFDVLLRAFAAYAGDGGGLDLLIAGDGPESRALNRLADELGMQDRVKLVGRTDRPTTASLFASCEFFVLPSRHEPFGIVNLEAMAAGKAVIASRVGGVPELVEDHKVGLLVPPEDVDALVDAIRQLAGSPALREQLGAAGRHRAERYSWPAITSQYLEIYGSALKSRAS